MALTSRSRPIIEAVRGDVTRQAVDAVVNAANEYLVAGGGVDGAIHETAGESALSAACAALGGCRVGDAKATPGFNLKAKFIIHTVGPRWRGGGQGEPELLASSYRRSLEVADEIGVTSLAFPAIATGAFGFPAEEAAEIAVTTLQDAPTSVRLIRLVAFDPTTLSLYERLLERERPGG